MENRRQQVNWRLSDTTREQLRYLSLLMHQSEARALSDLMQDIVTTIQAVAEERNTELKSDPKFLKNGGTIISSEEQFVLADIRKALQDMRGEG